MAAGAMASFISRVSSFLLAAATLSATNQPLNNQHHHHHHQLQQQQQHQHHTHPHLHHHHHNAAHNQHHRHQQHPNPNPHTHPHTHQPQPQPQNQIKFQQQQQQQHHQPTARHHFLQNTFPLSHSPLLTTQQLTNRQATVGFADLASSSTSRASNTIPGGGGGITFSGSGASSFVNPSSSASASASSSSSSTSPQAAPAQPQQLPASQVASAASSSLSPSPSSSSSAKLSSSSSSAVAAPPTASQTVGGLPSLSSSNMFDVFEYVMHYKPNTPLISPSSLTFSTIPINFNNKHQRQQHYQAAAAAAASSILQPISQPPLSQQQLPSSQQQQQQQQQNRKHHQQTFSQQVPLQQQQPQPLVQQQQQQQVQKQTTNNGSSSSLLEISRSSNSSLGRGILSRFSLLQSNNHQQQQQQRREDVCGRTMQTPQRRIIGGEGARYGEFPYQVHIKIAKHQCGGALIDKQSIVTAAHCVYHFMTRAPVSKLQIVIGAYDIEDEQYQELPPQYFKVNKVKLHPQFRFSASHPDRYDIAILKLDKPVKYTDNVLPVCLPSRDLKFESMIGTVTGFGKTDPSLSNRYGTRLLQKVDVPIIENNECERWHRTRGIDLKIFPEMMCAGYEDGLKDACVGDSGGPLVVKTSLGPNGSFRWTLAGITSAGFGCAQSRQPGIYHRVSHTVDWILDNLD